ncbi:hypothetical protein SDC9_90102 [bioreactor metagenome]|uniref:Uncharacterized protein n=1 Tax=bioreactor metagenome TaxID=1076179 RepID=A0A644ZSQ1_9ZZZZ
MQPGYRHHVGCSRPLQVGGNRVIQSRLVPGNKSGEKGGRVGGKHRLYTFPEGFGRRLGPVADRDPVRRGYRHLPVRLGGQEDALGWIVVRSLSHDKVGPAAGGNHRNAVARF